MDEVSRFVGSCLGSSSSDKKIFMPGSSSEMETIVWPGQSSRCYYLSCHGINAATRLLSNTQVPHLQDGRDPLLPSRISSSIFNQRTYSLFDTVSMNYLLIQEEDVRSKKVREFLFILNDIKHCIFTCSMNDGWINRIPKIRSSRGKKRSVD